jgi:hypothetical protein
MLGPLKFGLQNPLAAAVPTVKAAAAPGRFELELSLEGDLLDQFLIFGPKGATAYIDWGDGTNSSIGLTGRQYDIINHSCGSTATISGSNLINGFQLYQNNSLKLKGIVGTYPSSLAFLYVRFNYIDPVFTPPNVESLFFFESPGPSSLTTGSKLTGLHGLPPNLTTLNLSASTKLTVLPPLPSGLESLTTPPGLIGLSAVLPNLTSLDISRSTKLTTLSIPGAKITTLTPPPTCTTLNVSGCTGLTSLTVPSKVTSLNISKCTGITTVSFPPVLTTLRIDGSGITTLDLSKTNVTTLNIPPSMDTQLKTVAFGSKLKPSGLFRFEIPEDGVWTLY